MEFSLSWHGCYFYGWTLYDGCKTWQWHGLYLDRREQEKIKQITTSDNINYSDMHLLVELKARFHCYILVYQNFSYEYKMKRCITLWATSNSFMHSSDLNLNADLLKGFAPAGCFCQKTHCPQFNGPCHHHHHCVLHYDPASKLVYMYLL